MRKLALLLIGTLVLAGLAALALRWSGSGAEPQPGASLASALGDVDGLAARFPLPGDEPLAWPRDHGAKIDQFVESWLFAGMLQDEEGRRHGFQLAFYRVAVETDQPQRASAWATRDIYAARFALETEGAAVRGAERLGRGAMGLAGADATPAKAWLEDWSFTTDEGGRRFLLEGGVDGVEIRLQLLMPVAPPLPVPGDLYRGYWWPGLEVTGTIRNTDGSSEVNGRAMLDRLWGRGLPAGRGQLALARAWFDLDAGGAVRCEQLRRRAGGGTPLSECLAQPESLRDGLALEPEEGGWRILDATSFPLRWALRAAAGDAAQSFAPLSGERPLALDGAWSGIVANPDAGTSWGLLELSNFSAP
jgi:predicted secreted hydrolase